MYFYILYLAIYTYTHTHTHIYIYIHTHIHICIYKPPMWLSNKEFACQCKRDTGDAGLTPVWEDPLEKEVPTHFSILAWIIPWTEEPGGLQSLGLPKSQATNTLTFSNPPILLGRRFTFGCHLPPLQLCDLEVHRPDEPTVYLVLTMVPSCSCH